MSSVPTAVVVAAAAAAVLLQLLRLPLNYSPLNRGLKSVNIKLYYGIVLVRLQSVECNR